MTRTLFESLSGRKAVRARRNRRVRSLEVEAVEARCLLATVAWDLSGDGNWNSAANWVVEGTNPPPSASSAVAAAMSVPPAIRNIAQRHPGHSRPFHATRKRVVSGQRSGVSHRAALSHAGSHARARIAAISPASQPVLQAAWKL
jgi:hypothetical protein